MASPPSDDDLSSNPQLAGLFQTLSMDKDAGDIPSAAEVVDDYEGKQETLDLQISTGNNNEDDADMTVKMVKMMLTTIMVMKMVAIKQMQGFWDSMMWSKMHQKELQKEWMVNIKGLNIRFSIFLAGLLLTAAFSQMTKCTQFLARKRLIHDGEPFFSATPCANAPLLITAWIMDGYVKHYWN